MGKGKYFGHLYCFGTNDGKGVREVLEHYGGRDKNKLDYSIVGAIYYLSYDGTIMCLKEGTRSYNDVKAQCMEVRALDMCDERVKKGETYWYIALSDTKAYIDSAVEEGSFVDRVRFENGNYYTDDVICQADIDVINDVFKRRKRKG